jgi:hypothetical protein
MAEGHWQKFEPDAGRKLVAGNGTPALELVCGCFSASLSGSIDPALDHHGSPDFLRSGLCSRSTFFRAFHKSYGSAPMDHCDSPKRSSSSAPDEMRSEAPGGSCG